MKKIGLFIVLLCSFWCTAQLQSAEKNTVSVSGRTPVERTTALYRARVSLNMEQLYYSDPTCKSLDELKDKYFKELKIHGLDSNEFTEKQMDFLAYGYQRDGTILELETDSEEKIKSLAKVKMTGVSVQYQFKGVITKEKKEALLETALENAKQNAAGVCKVAGKKLGDIVSISDTNTQMELWNSYGNTYQEYITIYVTYKME
ncbi:SIMPL domain-containing protein [Croceitalea marina]|uniref:SIMPL domain-containing protein n=1 Tax=Croceitalea marina TaxID=1775166 RepID=A0ABW5MQF5_9FLAO